MTSAERSERFFSAFRVAIVAGKGGVGKTVVATALARAAARAGIDTLYVAVDPNGAGRHALGLDHIGYDEQQVTEHLRARALTPDTALVEYLRDHGLARIARHMATSGILEVVATATPGIKDLLVLGKIKQLETAGAASLIVVDAPAAGHAVTMLEAPHALAASAKVGAINQQAVEVLDMLRDPTRAQVLLVSLPEETPVNELIETAYRLEDQVGVTLGPVIVNGVLPEIAGLDTELDTRLDAAARRRIGAADLATLREAGRFWASRTRHQRAQIERLAEALPLPQIVLPQLRCSRVGSDESARLARVLSERIAGLGRPTR